MAGFFSLFNQCVKVTLLLQGSQCLESKYDVNGLKFPLVLLKCLNKKDDIEMKPQIFRSTKSTIIQR